MGIAAKAGELCRSVGCGVSAEVTASCCCESSPESVKRACVGSGMVFACFSDGLGEVVVKGRGCCEDLRCFVVRANYGEFAVVTCPESEEREDDGCVDHGIVIGVKKDGG